MSTQLTERDGGQVLEVVVSGKLTHDDYRHFVPAFEQRLKQHGKIRVLFEMNDFHGWDAAALWDDIKFDVAHFSDIDRLAMVGEKRWEQGWRSSAGRSRRRRFATSITATSRTRASGSRPPEPTA